MAEQEIILEINIQDSLAKTAELRGAIDDLIAQRQALAEQSKKGDEEAAKALEGVNAAVRNLQQEYRTQTKIIDGYVAAKKSEANVTDFAKNSIQQNRDLLKQLTAQYINLKNPSQQATNQIKELTKTLKQQEAAIGDTRRNVGNYFGDLQRFFGGGGVLGDVGDKFGIIAGGIKGMVGQLGILKGALAASGIGALLITIGSAATYFKSFEEGAELLERTMSGFGGAVDVLASKFGGLGKSIIDSVGDATQRTFGENVKAIGTSIKDGLISQVQGVGDTYKSLFKLISTFGKEGGKELQDAILRTLSFGKITRDGITDTIDLAAKAAKLAAEQTRAIQNLEEAEREYGRTITNNESEINRLRIAARVKGIEFNEQLKLLNKAAELEEENLRIQTDLAQKRYDIVKQQTDQKRELGLVTEKVTKEEYEAEQTLIRLKGQSATLQERINNQLQSVLEQRRAADKQQYDDFVAGINAANQVLTNSAEKEADTFKKINDKSVIELRKFIKQKQELYDKDVESLKNAELEKQKAQQATVLAAGEIAQSIVGFVQTVGEAQGAGAEFAKTMALVQIAVSQAIAIANAVVAATSAGAQSGIASIGVVPAYLATFIGITLGNIAQAVAILSSDTPQFAHGVIGLDGEGTETSDSIPAYLSKGESVLTAKATKRFHRELAFMEYAVGNSPNYQFGKGKFATGFIPEIPTVSDGGFSQRANRQDNTMALMMQEAIKAGFALAPAPKLSIVELESKQASRNRSVRVSEA